MEGQVGAEHPMTSLPTRLTAERLVEIRETFAALGAIQYVPNGLGHDSYMAIGDLLAHVKALEGERDTAHSLRNQIADENKRLFAKTLALEADLAACRRDQARYRVVREIVQPRYLSDGLGIKWSDIPNDQTIAEKIDELCDAALSAQAGTQIPATHNQESVK